MNKEYLNEANDLINNLSESLERLNSLSKRIFNGLDGDLKKKTSFMAKDIADIQNAVKNGDMDKLTEINKRYADINSK
jgi:hypothetical protein